ncbi:hypothetical protein [Vibrio algarum]|uniref:Uncharacterized protein n=1 Tax=Vibrio algarum TaxID=3020714 RepID=A0ABT4YUE6_9VIBR|nr:hypothetical protein [Vibrio sp. KJ40-1]MDB1125176.1 hypothetical protein [Vibrio sp. KJ40-1]
MRLVNYDWLYYVVVGFILGGGAAYLHAYLKVQSAKLKWYELFATVFIFITVVLMAQTVIASFNEGESRAAWLTIVFVGLPVVIITLSVTRSFLRRVSSNLSS